MSFDGFYTHAMTKELVDTLVNGRIHKIYQPYEQELQLTIRANRKNYRLEASIHPTYYRLHITQHKSTNPQHAPMFCMLLRKHLENATILDIRQYTNDRIIVFELSGRDELGDLQSYLLIFELMGRNSNILLVNPKTNQIIDCIKHISPAMNRHRSLIPGAKYVLPPQNDKQKNLFTFAQDELIQFAIKHQEMIEAGQAHKFIQGMSPLISRQLASWITDNHMTPYQALSNFMNQFNNIQPVIFKEKDQMKFYSFDLPYLQTDRQYFDTLGESLDAYYSEKARLDRVKQLSGDFIQRINQIIHKDLIKLDRLANDRKIAEAADTYRLKGELVNAYIYKIQKGQSEVTVENYYDNNQPCTIELDPRKSPSENSQSYFKKYTKYRDSLNYIDKQEQMTKAEIDYLESILVQLEQADIEDLEDIKDELEREGYGGKRNKSVKKRAKSTSKPRRYQSSDGVMIYVGRNNKQNDELSLKKASKNHWWLHTKNIPGAHVIVESDQPSEQTMLEAASIAAYYSKSQNSANVPVDAVQTKHLRKPNGAKPGFVIYEGQNTLYVTPVESEIKQLELKE
ncbi:NFACT family protein [Aerococcaceae bacterium WGS1372]